MTINKQTINEILVGKTHSLDRGDAGIAHLYMKDASTGFLKRGDENVMTGTWEATDKGFNVAWQGGPSREWLLDMTDEGLSFSLDGVGQLGVAPAGKNGDVENLEAVFSGGIK